ncbi:MAG: ATP-binding protein [Eggerthellaceae bacterium]|nr:ATP-binding protein [Eggerthellaceae bacterium]
MSNTTETVEACEFCGRPLERLTVNLGGVERPVGWKGCHCDGATAARVAEMQAEEERLAAERRNSEIRRLMGAGLPERYLGAEHPNAEAIADLWWDGMGFFIDGQQGTGKTHLAAAVFRTLCKMGCGARFVVVPDLMEAMRSRKTEDRDQTARLATVDVLVLDDLGKETPTPYACERLFDIVNARYNAMLPIGVTSNFTRGEIAQRLTEGDVGRSIASRLCEMTRRVHLDGVDRRLRHG